jgi:hypothetical protein
LQEEEAVALFREAMVVMEALVVAVIQQEDNTINLPRLARQTQEEAVVAALTTVVLVMGPLEVQE